MFLQQNDWRRSKCWLRRYLQNRDLVQKGFEEREESKSWLQRRLKKREDSMQRCFLWRRLVGCKSAWRIVTLQHGASEEVVSASR